jgi:hypothetical protein
MKLPSISEILGLPQIVPTRTNPAPVDFDPTKLGPKEVAFKWAATSRPPTQGMNKRLTRTFLIIGAVIALLLVIMQEFFLILIVASILFLTYVLSKTVPESLNYEISNHGVQIGERTYYWHQLRQFFFFQKNGLEVLAIDTYLGLPARLFLTINQSDKQALQDYLISRITFLAEEPKTPFDKAYESLLSKFNFEDK